MMEMILGIILFALGASIGSFINVIIDRLPSGQSIIHPPSHCPGCGRKLEPRDLVPVLSFIALRGRCRYCKAGIPLRLLIVEMASGLIFAALGLLLFSAFK